MTRTARRDARQTGEPTARTDGGAAAIEERVAGLDWPRIEADLDDRGIARLGRLLTARECRDLAALYGDETRFRSRIDMARHGFGRGEYKYFSRPLPDLVQGIREALYRQAVRTANRWATALGEEPFPTDLKGMLARCRAAGQTRPTPLLLRYRAGDYNCLHQDLYGPNVFPLQLVVMLSDPAGFEGGEFVMTEQRPRMQSRAEVMRLGLGEAALFAVNERPKAGTRGTYRVRMRHGVSEVRSGERMTMGVIFHDAA